MERVLHMTLIRKWFDQIADGSKTEEYREIKSYWASKLEHRQYDVIVFRNGYSPVAPTMRVEYKGFTKKLMTWDNGKTEIVYALRLGKILEIKNYGGSQDKIYEKARRKYYATY